MKTPYKILPWMFVALFATEIVAVLLPKKDGVFHTAEFGRLPVGLRGLRGLRGASGGFWRRSLGRHRRGAGASSQ